MARRRQLGVPKVKGRRSNRWFYLLLALLVVVGYVAVTWVTADTNGCTSSKYWSWSKVPPGYTCARAL